MPDSAVPSQQPASAARLKTLATRQLSLLAMRSDRTVNEALAGVRARKWHYAVLATLEEFGPASQAELSARTRIFRSDLVGVISELAATGFVSRKPDPDDGRRSVVTLTDKGRGRLQELDGIVHSVEDLVLDPLDARERGQLRALLAKLLEASRPSR